MKAFRETEFRTRDSFRSIDGGEKNIVRSQVEILAPAGSVASMKAAINAGADAVYMGGSRFGARAYADNPEEDQFLEAMDYAHLYGCRVYMTVNTLMKQQELDELYAYLKPYYERGVDAVLVQDYGAFMRIREFFPDLPLHVSTQMTVTGPCFAKRLKELGASRVVAARELSLEELREIRDQADIEVESFVHGALCYCYSGQCLMSSLIGGRSGNRGRCAQPCRLPYEWEKNPDQKNRYLLSMKDLCTLKLLPDILEAGVCSLKIEGRMKSPRYTAGVVRIYRKYVDRYLEKGRDGYYVEKADEEELLKLFDRGGLTSGYYQKHNGRDMIALREKPAFREGDQELFDFLDQQYVNIETQIPLVGNVLIHEGEPALFTLTVYCLTDSPVSVTVTGDMVQTARNQPMSEEQIRRQLNKTGNSRFYFESLTCDQKGSCFLPMQALNELRRRGMNAITEELLKPYRRSMPLTADIRDRQNLRSSERLHSRKSVPRLHVSLEELRGLDTVLGHREVSEIYLDACEIGADLWSDTVKACHSAGKSCVLMLPQIFRTEARDYFLLHQKELKGAGFDAFVVRSLEETGFLKELGMDQPLIFDANLYAWNHQAEEFLYREGASRLTLPLELNSRELESLGCRGRELIVYGYFPVMVSAQCVQNTGNGCNRKPGLLRMKDRTGRVFPVRNHCRFCYNTIYNPSPLSLLGQEQLVKKLEPWSLRLQFTWEDPARMEEILLAYKESFLYGRKTEYPEREFTRGHFKRGVE